MDLSLSDKVAVVTGGSSGIGRAIVALRGRLGSTVSHGCDGLCSAVRYEAAAAS